MSDNVMMGTLRPSAESIRDELETTRSAFHALPGSLPEGDWRGKSLNPGWTNGDVMGHMLFGFLILNVLLPIARVWGRLPQGSSRPFARLLNASAGPFHWLNERGARMQARIFTRKRIGKIYDRVHPNFSEFMTLEKLFLYPVIHFNFHRDQISGRRRT